MCRFRVPITIKDSNINFPRLKQVERAEDISVYVLQSLSMFLLQEELPKIAQSIPSVKSVERKSSHIIVQQSDQKFM